MIRDRLAPLLLAAALALPAAMHAQVVQGRVVEEGSSAPVGGAIVQLLDASGARRGATLTEADGSYRVQAPGAGTFRLRVERVGFTNSTSAPVRLVVGETVELPLIAEARRVVLEAVVASGRSRRCAGAINNGAQAATAWSEARKALLSMQLAAETGRYRFRTEIRERRVTTQGGRVLDQEVTETISNGLPFKSRDPETLIRNGYVVLTSRDVRFFGVDAAAILSDAFLEHHCFGLRDGGPERPGMVGLEFMPLANRSQPDVQGVLWLDRASAELRYAEYQYTGLRFSGPTDRIRGRMDFRRLPSGLWVTESWRLDTPLLRDDNEFARVGTMERYRMFAVLERSGRIVEVQRIAMPE